MLSKTLWGHPAYDGDSVKVLLATAITFDTS
jgi:hypothetical protein